MAVCLVLEQPKRSANNIFECSWVNDEDMALGSTPGPCLFPVCLLPWYLLPRLSACMAFLNRVFLSRYLCLCALTSSKPPVTINFASVEVSATDPQQWKSDQFAMIRQTYCILSRSIPNPKSVVFPRVLYIISIIIYILMYLMSHIMIHSDFDHEILCRWFYCND